MARRCFPVAKIAGSSPTRYIISKMNGGCKEYSNSEISVASILPNFWTLWTAFVNGLEKYVIQSLYGSRTYPADECPLRIAFDTSRYKCRAYNIETRFFG